MLTRLCQGNLEFISGGLLHLVSRHRHRLVPCKEAHTSVFVGNVRAMRRQPGGGQQGRAGGQAGG